MATSGSFTRGITGAIKFILEWKQTKDYVNNYYNISCFKKSDLISVITSNLNLGLKSIFNLTKNKKAVNTNVQPPFSKNRWIFIIEHFFVIVNYSTHVIQYNITNFLYFETIFLINQTDSLLV